MSRFDLKKDERFDLHKDSGLSKIKVHLGWKKGADLDACAFLLGEDGIILDDADFIYYKSENREKPFSKDEFGNKGNWRAKTRPMSADGSVLGSIDDRGDGNGDEDDEEMYVNLEKVGPKISEITFCVTVFNENGENKSFKDVRDPYITLINESNGEELCRYDLKENFSNETAVVIASLICNDEGEWTFEAQGKGYDGGMETLIDIYAS
jgi:tellurium resistance protein TerD